VSAADDQANTGGETRELKREERRQLAVLGLPTFGMALAITMVSSYLPVVASTFTGSTTVIGLIIGGEGLVALWLPLIVGSWSDRLETTIGRRLPFVLAGTPLMLLGLILMGLVQSLVALAVVVGAFFIGYFVAYEPYRALYPDLMDDEIVGRAQGNQAVWRGVGTGLALLSGGVLLSVSDFVPFVSAALMVAASIGIFAWLLVRRGETASRRRPEGEGVASAARRIRELLVEHPALRTYVGANALWELAMGALKTFIVLYVTAGLGFSLSAASLVIGLVGVVIFGGALASGVLADRYGRLRVMEVGLWVYGISLLVPLFTSASVPMVVATPVIAFGGGMIMGLPYAILMPLMPDGEHGAITGIYSLSRGIGITLGPLLAGLAIQLLGPGVFDSTQGYGAMWIVVAGAILASILPLRHLRGLKDDRRALRSSRSDRGPRGDGRTSVAEGSAS
jgi:MFS family permease